MAIQFSTTVRNAILDQIETTTGVSAILRIWQGTEPATCGTADLAVGNKLVEYTLASDWAANASAGSKTFNNTPISGTAINTGTASFFRLYDSTGSTCHMQGTVTATGGGGDATISNVSITSGQTINITSWSITAPGA